MVRNILGQGIDIHLLGLRQAAVENDFEAEIFQDPSYAAINHFALSTSQVKYSKPLQSQFHFK